MYWLKTGSVEVYLGAMDLILQEPFEIDVAWDSSGCLSLHIGKFFVNTGKFKHNSAPTYSKHAELQYNMIQVGFALECSAVD